MRGNVALHGSSLSSGLPPTPETSSPGPGNSLFLLSSALATGKKTNPETYRSKNPLGKNSIFSENGGGEVRETSRSGGKKEKKLAHDIPEEKKKNSGETRGLRGSGKKKKKKKREKSPEKGGKKKVHLSRPSLGARRFSGELSEKGGAGGRGLSEEPGKKRGEKIQMLLSRGKSLLPSRGDPGGGDYTLGGLSSSLTASFSRTPLGSSKEGGGGRKKIYGGTISSELGGKDGNLHRKRISGEKNYEKNLPDARLSEGERRDAGTRRRGGGKGASHSSRKGGGGVFGGGEIFRAPPGKPLGGHLPPRNDLG
jgi:hypothetical protein